jgi:hypothetical protein
MRKKFVIYDDDGGSEDVWLPMKYEVCGRCEGKGVHDCWDGGMTGDEMAEQGPDFYEDYMGGMYDKQCDECKGERVVAVVNRTLVTKEMLERYDRHEEAMYGLYAAEQAEREYFQRAAEAMSRW